MTALLDAIGAYLKSFRLITKLRLWGYVLLPAFISLVFAGLIGFSAWNLSDNIGDLVTGWYKWDFGSGVIETIGSVLGGAIIVAFSLIIFKHIILVLVSPFMSLLSEKVEAHLTGFKSDATFNIPEMLSDILRGLRIALRNIAKELSLTVVLLVLGLIIPLLSPITTILIFIIQAYYAGFGNMDYTLERHFNVKESRIFVKQNRMMALGNGIPFMLLLLTGIGFLIAPPLATIAATIEVSERLN